MRNQKFAISTGLGNAICAPPLAGIILALGMSSFTTFASAEGGQPTPCERTASKMKSACKIDAREELQIQLANCANLELGSDRAACQMAAREAAEDAPEACRAQFEARRAVCTALGEFRYAPDPLLDPANYFVDPNDIPSTVAPNPLLSLQAGLVNVLRGGEDGEEVVVIVNTDETREINGVNCRVVAEAAVIETEETDEDSGRLEIEYVPKEVTFDFFAQNHKGDVVYCGENTVEYDEDGYPVSTDGTFIAGIENAKSGYLARFAPQVGEGHRQEFALDEAEDVVFYESLAASPDDAYGGEVEGFECLGGCTETRDLTPIEPDAKELKYYLPGTGFVLALPFEINDEGEFEWTEEREELVCQGNSINILKRSKCEIADGKELTETLCQTAGDFFCDD